MDHDRQSMELQAPITTRRTIAVDFALSALLAIATVVVAKLRVFGEPSSIPLAFSLACLAVRIFARARVSFRFLSVALSAITLASGYWAVLLTLFLSRSLSVSEAREHLSYRLTYFASFVAISAIVLASIGLPVWIVETRLRKRLRNTTALGLR